MDMAVHSGASEDYVNHPTNRNVVPKRGFGGPLKCVVVGFGLLCILQVTLNISLRLSSSTSLAAETGQCRDVIGEYAQQGWLYFNNSFYYISATKKNWTASRRACVYSNADLVVINSIEEQKFTMRLHGDSQSWIGLKVRGPERDWEWVDGTNLTSSYWSKGEPNNVDRNQDCVQIYQDKWQDISCDGKNSWICEKKRNSEGLHCMLQVDLCLPASDWHSFQDSYYFASDTMKSWQDSRNDCLQKNADLVVINSQEEQAFTKTLKDHHWIGLSDRETEGEWKWVDGSGITFRNWATNEPNGQENKEDCAQFFLRDKVNSWNDAICQTKSFWICEKDADVALLEGVWNPEGQP